jgi:hypothetical protein
MSGTQEKVKENEETDRKLFYFIFFSIFNCLDRVLPIQH